MGHWLWKSTGVVAVLIGVGVVALDASSESPTSRRALETLIAKYQRQKDVPAAGDNPPSPEKIALGKQLFFDPRLSGSGVISCASCHNPALGWQDGLAKGRGHMGGELGRHTPTILNVAWGGPYFWDGRADTLEAQAKGPIQAEKEMNMSAGNAVKTVADIKGYRDSFARVFPNEGVTLDTMAKAIAAYERTVVSGDAPFDRWVSGDDHAISEEAKLGFIVFNGKGKCATCHQGWRFTDDGFHDIGINDEDPGRGKLVPGADFLNHAFKTPTLRNVAERAPYMHDGSLPTLDAVVDHYDHGFVQRSSLSSDVTPLHLTADEKRELVAFVRTLSSQDAPETIPQLPR
jgi:cytochrome c peroxidase